MISLEHVRLEDVPFIDLQPQADETNENGIVNEPVIIDTRTGKPYMNPDRPECPARRSPQARKSGHARLPRDSRAHSWRRAFGTLLRAFLARWRAAGCKQCAS